MKTKFLRNLTIASALLIPSFSALADGYLLGEGPDTAVAFNEVKLTNFLNKYHIPVKVSSAAFNPQQNYFDVGGYQLRYGVFMLQTSDENGDRDDLILGSKEQAQQFEKELIATTNNGINKFYEAPVIGVASHKVVALGYTTPPDVNGTVKVRHYFIANEWGWEPGKNE